MAESGNRFQKHLSWPHPVPLSPQLLSLWQQALSLSLLCPGTTTRWLWPSFEVGGRFDTDLLSEWPWRYSPVSFCLFHRAWLWWSFWMPHYLETRAQRFHLSSIWNIEPFDLSQYDCSTVENLPNVYVTIKNHAPVAPSPRLLPPLEADPFQHTVPTFSSLLTCTITEPCFLLDRLCHNPSCCDLFAAAV